MSVKEVKELITQLEKIAIPILDGQKKEDVYGAVRNLFCAMLVNVYNLDVTCCCNLIHSIDDHVVSMVENERRKH